MHIFDFFRDIFSVFGAVSRFFWCKIWFFLKSCQCKRNDKYKVCLFGQNDFLLRGGGGYPPIIRRKKSAETAMLGQKKPVLAIFDPFVRTNFRRFSVKGGVFDSFPYFYNGKSRPQIQLN